MARRKKSVIPGLSFSYKRAFGITKMKRKISRATGIPMTKQGRRNKAARIMTGGGCLLPVIVTLLIATVLAICIF